MKVGVTTFMTDEGIRPAPLAKALEERGFDSLLTATFQWCERRRFPGVASYLACITAPSTHSSR
jgi:hypothetical protein